MLIQSFLASLRRSPSLIRFVGLALLCFFVVVGCQTPPNSNSVDNASPSNTGRITIGTTLKPRTLDPADSYELSGLNLIYNLSDRLYTYELGSTELQPQLATAMPTVSPDGLTYTIPLREGVTFHDGAPFNAEAMAFSLERFMKNGGKPAFLLADTIDTVKASGEYELTIQLKEPFAAFPSLLAFTGACAVSPQAYAVGSGKFEPESFVGTGPYELKELTSDTVRLDVFEGYWGEKPANKGVDVQIYTSNPANLYNAFRTGAVDVAYQTLDPDQIQSLVGDQGQQSGQWQVIEAPGTAISYMVLNLQQEPLNRLEVRQAIAALMDRKLINERVLNGQGTPLFSLIPTIFEEYKPVFEQAYGDGNSEKAKQLLQKAGYTPSSPATVEVWYPSGSPVRELVASILQALAKEKTGGLLNLEPKTVEATTAYSNLPKGIYPAFLVDWYPDFMDADNYIQPFLDCSQGSAKTGCQAGGAQTQGSFYWNETMNQLIRQQRQELDGTKRKQLLSQIQDVLVKDVPYIPLWQNKEFAFAQQGVEGVQINPSQSFPFWPIQHTRSPLPQS